MIIDIILVSLLVIITALGYRYGFIFTFFHLTGWLLSLLCGFIFSSRLKTYLIENDIFYSWINGKIQLKIPDGFKESSLEFTGVPSILNDLIVSLTTDFSKTVATQITDFVMSVVSFLILVFLIKIVLFFFIALFSKKNNTGATGLIDGVLGLGFGFIKGMVVIYFLLAVMIPLVNLGSPEHTFLLLTNLDSSTIAKDLFNNNPLLLLISN